MKNNPANNSPVNSLGVACVVAYKPATGNTGSRWIATIRIDGEKDMRAVAPFNYSGKENEGADTAARACLAKYTAWCNVPCAHPIKHKFSGRAYIGDTRFVYTIAIA